MHIGNILLRRKSKPFCKAKLFENIIITIVISTFTCVEFSGLLPTASHRVVLEFIQNDGAFAKLKPIILCKFHGASLCFNTDRVTYNKCINFN